MMIIQNYHTKLVCFTNKHHMFAKERSKYDTARLGDP